MQGNQIFSDDADGLYLSESNFSSRAIAYLLEWFCMNLNHYTLEVDSGTKNFRWSTPVYVGKDSLPTAAGSFLSMACVQKNAGEEQRITQLVLEKNKVLLREDIPFSQGPQSTMRQRFYYFLRRAEKCRELLRMISMIEKVRDAKSCGEQ